MNPREKAARPFNTLFEAYDAWYEREPGCSLFEIEAAALKEMMPNMSGTIIEIGVGSGRFAQFLEIPYGLDPALQPLRIAKRRGIRSVAADAVLMPFRDGEISCCLLMVTLCFVADPLKVLKEVFRILKPGGSILLGMVLRESPWGADYLAKAERGHPFYTLATFLSYNDILALLLKSGFQFPEVVSTLFQPPRMPSYRPEIYRKGYFPEAGFTVFLATKRAQR
jgi:SAM-dependent methyltransferase